MPPELTGELKSILTAAAFAPLNDRAFLRITGPDAPRWLNGMVTNNIQALNPGEGNYNFLLNAQGRIQGDCTVYRDPVPPHSVTQNSDLNRPTAPSAAVLPAYTLETDTAQLEPVQQLLDRFIIMDDVELTPGFQSGTDEPVASPSGILLLGPEVADLLNRLMTSVDFAALGPLSAGTLTLASFDGHEVRILTSPTTLVQSYEIWCKDPSVQEELSRILEFHRVLQVSPETLEQLRVLEARPRYGTDIRNTDTAKDLPQETNQPHALHFAKGCYVGQEIVERIRSRGQVHRLFTPFRLEGALPTAFPAALQANGKPAGELTSAVTVPTTEGPVHLALGYARREALDTQAILIYPGGTAHRRTPGFLT